MQKITPTHDLSWYLKWTGSMFIMSGIVCRAVGVFPFYDLCSSFIGTGLLAGMAYLWHDRALLMVNGVACAALAMGILRYISST
tara:strand:- start:176 stop:427 length:252 start_codon:yes stop_codon:yes gene_type:complete